MAQIENAVTDRSATGEDSTQIRSEIERTRADLDETFDAIGEKLTPTELLKEGWSLFKGGSSAGSSKMLQVAREHPLPAAVIALGFGWLLLDSSRDRSERRSYRRGAYSGGRYGARGFSDDYGTAGYGTSRGYGTTGAYDADLTGQEGEEHGRLAGAKEVVAGAAHSVRDKAGDVKERVGEIAGHARERAGELRGRVRQGTRRAKTGFWETLEERPLAVGAATLALGALVGLTIPSTRKEDELFGETRDELLDQAKDKSREAFDKGKQVAQSVAETVKHEAQSEGLTPSGLADKVRSVAHEAKETVKREAERQNLTGGQQQPGGQGQQGQAGGAKDRAETPAEPELAKR